MKSRKIRVFPTLNQRKTLDEWFGAARWTYNKCLEAIKAKMASLNKKSLRALALNSDSALVKENKWLLDTPYDFRDEAMNDLLKAYDSNFAAGRTNFEIHFRSKKDNTQSLVVLKQRWNATRGVVSSVFSPRNLRAECPLPDDLPADARFIRTRLGQYFLCLPEPITQWTPGKQPIKPKRTPAGIDLDECGICVVAGTENQGPDPAKHCTVALDPGVRTFMTGYDADGRIIEWGKKDIARIHRLCSFYDKLQSKWSAQGVPKRNRRRMRRAGLRLQQKIRDLVDELHKKLARWLCLNFRVVMLPVFETSRMVPRNGRRLNSRTARAMLTWSHFRFRQRLLHKAREFEHCNIYLCTEEYTSKTCTMCGRIHEQLGGSKQFHCPSCHVLLDRDVNGARNILIKFLTQRVKSTSRNYLDVVPGLRLPSSGPFPGAEAGSTTTVWC